MCVWMHGEERVDKGHTIPVPNPFPSAMVFVCFSLSSLLQQGMSLM
jgi:hypothetical protein